MLQINSTFVTRRGRGWPFILADGKKTCAYSFWQGAADVAVCALAVRLHLPCLVYLCAIDGAGLVLPSSFPFLVRTPSTRPSDIYKMRYNVTGIRGDI